MTLQSAVVAMALSFLIAISSSAKAQIVGKSISFSLTVYKDGQEVPQNEVRLYIGKTAVFDYAAVGARGVEFPYGRKISIGSTSVSYKISGNTIISYLYSPGDLRSDVVQYIFVQGNSCVVQYKSNISSISTQTNSCTVSDGNIF